MPEFKITVHTDEDYHGSEPHFRAVRGFVKMVHSSGTAVEYRIKAPSLAVAEWRLAEDLNGAFGYGFSSSGLTFETRPLARPSADAPALARVQLVKAALSEFERGPDKLFVYFTPRGEDLTDEQCEWLGEYLAPAKLLVLPEDRRDCFVAVELSPEDEEES